MALAQLNIEVSAPPQQLASINSGRPMRPEYRAGWYILRSWAGSEFRARKALGDSGFSAFLPVERKERVTLFGRKSATTEYPRFPRYLFVRINPPQWPTIAVWPLCELLQGFLRMDGAPVPLAPGEYERLRQEDGRPVPHVTSVPLHRAFQAGDRVRVKAGAWRDWVVQIDALDACGAHVSVPLFGRPNEAVLPLNWLEAA